MESQVCPKENNNVFNKIDNISQSQSKSCNDNCRYYVYVIITAVWAFIVRTDINPQLACDDKTLLFAILCLALLYLFLDVFMYYYVAYNSVKLQKKLNAHIITEEEAKAEMNSISTLTYVKLKYQIPYCLLLTILMGVYLWNVMC